MNKTRHAHTNYIALEPFLEAVNAAENQHRRFTSRGYMPLSLERLEGCTDHKGRPIYAMAHYTEQNGDLMADPDMEIAVDFENEIIEPRTYQNDFMGIYQEVYRRNDAGQLTYSPRLRTELDDFLWLWLKNIKEQLFDPTVYERRPA